MSDAGKSKEGLELGVSPASEPAVDSPALPANGNHSSEFLEQFAALIADTVPQSIWVTDANGNVKFLNKQWYEYSGTSERPITAAEVAAESVHPDDAPALLAAFQDAIRTGNGFEIEQRNRSASGEYRWFLNRANPYREAGTGVIKFWFGVSIDIHDRKVGRDDEKLLFDISELIRVAEDPEELLGEISDRLGRFLDVHRCLFNEIDLEGDNETVHRDFARDGESVAGRHKISIYSPEASEAMAAGKSIVNHDSEKDPRTAPYFQTTYKPAKELAYITVPMMRNGRWVASLWCSDDRPRQWDSREVALVETIAERAWAAVERLRAEDALRESEKRYRALTELSPQMVYMCRPDGSITYVNQYTIEWTGKTLEELKGDVWGELIHPNHRERIFKVWQTATVVASEYEVDVPFRHVDGTYRTLYNRALPIKDENGEVLYWIGTALDVEDRKRAEENLRESEQRFRQVSDSAPVLIWMSDTTKKFVWFNKPWLDFTGRTMEDESGEGWFEGVHPEDRERCWNVYSMSFKNRQEFAMEYRLRRADGEYRWLLDRGVPRLTPDETFLGFIGSCIDIHDRRAAESALRRSEARLQLATRLGGYGTWDINAAESRHIWSDKLFEIFGIAPTPDRSVTNELFEKYIYQEDLQKLHELNEKAQSTREHFTAEYRIRRADTGEMRWVDAAAQHFFDSEGTLLRTIGIAQDITERKLANEAVRASEERLTLAQEAGNVGVWDWDAATNLTFWSEQMWAFYGENPQEFGPPHESWIERLHPDDRRRMDDAVTSSLRSDKSELKEEFRVYRKDGDLRWLEVIANIERDGSGAATRMYGVNLDITERKAIAERIRSSEAQLRLVTDSIPALVSYIDREEKYRFINQKYSEWFGLDRDEMIGHTMEEVLGSAAIVQLRPRIEEVLLGNTISFEAWVDYKAAGRKFVHISYVPDIHDSGEVSGFYALVTDLTAQKLSEEMLRSTEDRMRIISESFTDYAIISMDAEGRIESWNAGAENIFGFTADEIIGRSASILFTPEDAARGVPAEELRQAEKLGRASDERWHMRKDGTRFYASGVAAPLYVGEKLTGFAKIATDLTEKKRNAEALQRAYDEMENRVLERTRELASMNETLMREISERQTAERQKIELLKRLVSGQEEERRRIARDLHDHLGQRLTALRLKLASLREACAGDEELYGRATRLQQIAELIDSEVSFLAWELRPSTLDELGLIDAIGAFVKEWSRHYEINAEFHSTGLGEVRLDREAETHLYRITQEALNNIYKHADAHNVSVLVERAGREVILIIEDDGAGFTQSETQRDRMSNRGLGLGGMRERADLIGGTLEIESEVGKGTTIYVRIPVEPDQGLNDER
jgi:PAS domain S-box-containing protein